MATAPPESDGLNHPAAPVHVVALAAGLGSRFGGAKQVEGFGPSGETLLELNTFDAWRAGAVGAVWVTRPSLVDACRALADPIPPPFSVRIAQQSDRLRPDEPNSVRRERPWGTAHAWMAAGPSDGVQLVLNADDLYGPAAIRAVTHAARTPRPGGTARPAAWVAGYRAADTLSEHGGVSRARIEIDPAGSHAVSSVTELTDVRRTHGVIRGIDSSGNANELDDATLVSMNLWAFAGPWDVELARALRRFEATSADDPEAEFRLPDVVFDAVSEGTADVTVVPVAGRWAGVTYALDRPHLQARLLEEFASGTYPSPLFTPEASLPDACS